MAKQTKTKAKAVVAVPQSRAEAAGALRQVGELDRRHARIEADMNDELAAVKERYAAHAAPIAAQAQALRVGLQTWCEANRSAICAKGTKTADLGTGKVSWRLTPPKVNLRGVDEIIAQAKRLGLLQFVRIKEEPNKEAMLADVDRARLIAGVTIGSEGEEFIAEPFEVDLDAAVAA